VTFPSLIFRTGRSPTLFVALSVQNRITASEHLICHTFPGSRNLTAQASMPPQYYEQRANCYCYSVLKACDGLVEAARCAGMSPAAAAAAVNVKVAMARTAKLMPLDS
jgi:hypothetical protein